MLGEHPHDPVPRVADRAPGDFELAEKDFPRIDACCRGRGFGEAMSNISVVADFRTIGITKFQRTWVSYLREGGDVPAVLVDDDDPTPVKNDGVVK
jgi:hypothetical protein